MRKLTQVVTLALIVSSVVIEWLFLTGAPPTQQALGALFFPAPLAAIPPARPLRPNFQTGVVFPRWGMDAYTSIDRNYGIGLDEIQSQTGARWIEITIDLHQATYRSTVVYPGLDTPTPVSIEQGITRAHAQGFRVFVTPQITLDTPAPTGLRWAGDISLKRARDLTNWFYNYWQALHSYMEVAQRAHADQVAIGTEFSHLESAPDNYWYWLIAQVRAVYSGRLTYDLNHTSLNQPVRPWMRDPNLAALGVSLYTSITAGPPPKSPSVLAALWAERAGALLDDFARRAGKPLIISEIGYRNASDALFEPYQQITTAPLDPALQANAYAAALINVMSDSYIVGVYFWAWSLPPFSPNWLPAAKVLKSWYTSPLA